MGSTGNKMAYTFPRVPKVEICCVWISTLSGLGSRVHRNEAYHGDAKGLANFTYSDATQGLGIV